MSLTKNQRAIVWAKSDGHCWYCGDPLPVKGWHADHFEPVIRESRLVRDESDSEHTHKFVSTGKMLHEKKDTLENMVPSCAACNLFKSTFDVEFFRQEIAAQIERVRKNAGSGFRIAERFGLIQCQAKDVVFWFEQNGKAP